MIALMCSSAFITGVIHPRTIPICAAVLEVGSGGESTTFAVDGCCAGKLLAVVVGSHVV